MFKKPIILDVETLSRTKHFHIEKLKLQFSNGEKRDYERLKGSSSGAVLVIPMLDNDTVLMIYEYSGGTNKYELGLPKGKIDKGETPLEAANRELSEEVGFSAKKLTYLKEMTLAPGYQSNHTHIILAQDLYPKITKGDEPEPLVVVEKKLSQLNELIQDNDLSEARSIAALFMVRDYL
ncbi:ADP compounds hydrolase NudE [hydrothermal vent metagenome]|uniref:ADP compounds hydrolase NudE n=1 Tax=hydrothermal vent metagenome TaxID=652676 RepID=A0A1W1C3I7_9ZZZZ